VPRVEYEKLSKARLGTAAAVQARVEAAVGAFRGHERRQQRRHAPGGGMMQVIDSLKLDDSGKFLDWQGNEVQW